MAFYGDFYEAAKRQGNAWATAVKCLAFAAILSLASPSWAVNGWFSNPDCTGGSPSSLVSAPVYFCADSTAVLNSFSSVLQTRGFVLYISRTGDRNQLLAGIGEVKVFEHPGAAGAAVTASTGLDQRGADVDGDGIEDTLSLNGAVSRGSLNGFTATGLTLQITALPAATEQMVITVVGVK